MLGKLAAFLIILVAAVAYFALDYVDPEPSQQRCPSCGTTTLVLVRTSVGASTVMACTTCGKEVTIYD